MIPNCSVTHSLPSQQNYMPSNSRVGQRGGQSGWRQGVEGSGVPIPVSSLWVHPSSDGIGFPDQHMGALWSGPTCSRCRGGFSLVRCKCPMGSFILVKDQRCAPVPRPLLLRGAHGRGQASPRRSPCCTRAREQRRPRGPGSFLGPLQQQSGPSACLGYFIAPPTLGVAGGQGE